MITQIDYELPSKTYHDNGYPHMGHDVQRHLRQLGQDQKKAQETLTTSLGP